MDVSQNHYAEWKKFNIEEYILYDLVSIKL